MGPAIAEAGQNVARSIAASQTAVERKQQELGLRLLESQIGETDARRDYYISEAARARQGANAAQTFPMAEGGPVTVGELEVSDTLRGQAVVNPTEAYSRSQERSDTAASSTPLWRAFEYAPGKMMVLPGGMTGDPSEALETLAESPLLGAMVLMENERRSPGFIREFLTERVPGGRTVVGYWDWAGRAAQFLEDWARGRKGRVLP